MAQVADAEAPEVGKGSALGKFKAAARTVAVATALAADRKKRFDPHTGAERKSVVAAIADHKEHAKEHGKCDEGTLAHFTQHKLEHMWYKLGIWIGFNPYKSIAIGALILLSGVPATFVLPGPANLLWIKMAAGFEPFAITNSDQYYDRDTSNGLHDSFFVPVHGRASVVSFLPRDHVATPVFSQAFMAAVLPIVMGIYAIEADGYGFKQLCVPIGSKPFGSTLTSYTECASTANDVFSAVNWDSSAIPAAGAGVAAYGAGAHDYAGPLSTLDSGLLGPRGINATGIFRSLVTLKEEPSLPYTQWQARSLSVPFLVVDDRSKSGEGVNAQAQEWMQNFISYLKSDYPNKNVIEAVMITDQAVTDGLQELLNTFVPFLFLVTGIMTGYSVIFLYSQTRTNVGEATQIMLIAQGVSVSAMAGMSGMGWMLYLGQKDIVVLCAMALFLVMAVGVDCTFIFVSAMKGAGPDTAIEEATGLMLAEGATAVSLTSATSIGCFIVSALTSSSQPAFVKFNLTMAVALILNFLGFLFYFSGLSVLNEHRIVNGKSDLMPWKPKKAGYKISSAWDPGSKVRAFLNDKYAPLFVSSMPFKLGGLAFIVISTALGGIFMGEIGTGLAQTTFLVYSSFINDFFNNAEDNNQNFGTNTVLMQVENLDMADLAALNTFKALVIDTIAARSVTMFTLCLPASYLFYRDQGGIEPWYDWLQTDATAKVIFGHQFYPANAGAATAPQTIECSFSFLDDIVSQDSKTRIANMDAYYDMVDAANVAMSSINVKVRLNSFGWAINTALDKEAKSLVWSAIAISLGTVTIILMFVLPVSRALITTANIGLVVYAIIGFMGYVGYNYNLLTMCVTSMSIGFCVDYTVEVVHFSMLAPPGNPMSQRFVHAMRGCGYDVLHGCNTAVLGVLCLCLMPSGAPFGFGSTTLIMAFYGGMYSLWSLPSVLVLVDDLFCGGKGKKISPVSSTA